MKADNRNESYIQLHAIRMTLTFVAVSVTVVMCFRMFVFIFATRYVIESMIVGRFTTKIS